MRNTNCCLFDYSSCIHILLHIFHLIGSVFCLVFQFICSFFCRRVAGSEGKQAAQRKYIEYFFHGFISLVVGSYIKPPVAAQHSFALVTCIFKSDTITPEYSSKII